ncbi:hypothetical protein [Peribacillus frigoritolerans]|nr:hypothetical protein [Peribacillus frigoritolerans]MDM5306373.1 hypothetical protein [Peribacillus frigoritolerans]
MSSHNIQIKKVEFLNKFSIKDYYLKKSGLIIQKLKDPKVDE